MDEPLDNQDAKTLVRDILQKGSVRFSGHALQEMEKDGLLDVDVANVLRGGLMSMPAEFEKGSWRYRFETQRIAVVIVFRSESVLVVVTAWRK